VPKEVQDLHESSELMTRITAVRGPKGHCESTQVILVRWLWTFISTAAAAGAASEALKGSFVESCWLGM